ncbi:MAG: cation:proton antiporter, partial [Bacteroidales bacterium]|nr:cation:proton antiporter [Bacteroidales bacterium]
MQIELLLLIISALFFVSILVSKAGSKFGVPALLLFLLVGMLFGSDGLGIQFDNIFAAQGISTVALCIILFSGGMDTKLEDVKPVAGPGIMLATVGVLVTAVSTALIIWFTESKLSNSPQLGLLAALLLASTMSSTDSASVFSILR